MRQSPRLPQININPRVDIQQEQTVVALTDTSSQSINLTLIAEQSQSSITGSPRSRILPPAHLSMIHSLNTVLPEYEEHVVDLQ